MIVRLENTSVPVLDFVLLVLLIALFAMVACHRAAQNVLKDFSSIKPRNNVINVLNSVNNATPFNTVKGANQVHLLPS